MTERAHIKEVKHDDDVVCASESNDEELDTDPFDDTPTAAEELH